MENRRDLLKLAGLSLAGAGGFALPAAASLEAHLPNAMVNASAAKLTREKFGENRVFFQGPTAQLKSMTAGSLLLNAGMEPHPPHQHPEEEFMIITEGTGDMLIDGKHVPVGPGCMMYCEANQLHGIHNNSSAPLLFYYYKWLA